MNPPAGATPSPRVVQLLRHLEAWTQEELGGKRRMIELLDAQERALSGADPVALADATQAVAAVVEAEAPRARVRHELVQALANEWSVAAGSLTLGSIALRAGSAGVRLGKLRAELRAACEQAVSRGRRIALVSQAQRAVLAEVLHAVVAAGGPDEDGNGGLVDAKG